MVEKILNNTTPYGKIRAYSLHSSTLRLLCCCSWPNSFTAIKGSVSIVLHIGLL